MSIFNELLPKILDISKTSTKNFNDDLKAAFEVLDKFEEEFQNGRGAGREKPQKDKNLMTTLQSINEDDDEPNKTPESSKTDTDNGKSSMESGEERRLSKKRSKDEVASSPETDTRQKRKCHVKAQSNITKQANTNLIQKLRREDTADRPRARRKGHDKENSLAVPAIQIKQEKISLPPEPMETESLPIHVVTKREMGTDETAMPPPAAPVPKPRKAVQKNEDSDEESGPGRRRTNRGRKQEPEAMPPPPAPSARSTRASSRASSRTTKQTEAEEPPLDTRPKRTRTKKQVSETPSVVDSEKENLQPPQENGLVSPNEKQRQKRTRRGQKAAEKEIEKPKEAEATISPKKEKISHTEPTSPVLQKDLKKPKNNNKNLQKQHSDEQQPNKKNKADKNDMKQHDSHAIETVEITLEETKILNVTVTLNNDMDKTMILPNGVYNHAPVTPKTVVSTTTCHNDVTVVLESCGRETVVLDQPHQHHAIMDATVVIEKDPKATNLTYNSILTDDNSDLDAHTPPKEIPKHQPSSAVKEKVQQFEELAARTTRTKTRAMAKMEDQDNHTPPDKMIKPVLSAETLNKMNNMIFNGKQPQISSSASKPRVPGPAARPPAPASASKLSGLGLGRPRDAADDAREDARKKKEALLEAKRELQKKKREDKMAAAAATREAAERERRLALEAAARERLERQAHADLGRLERLKEAERKKQELARKVAETEERRKAEEQARQQRLAEEQKRADAARRKQVEEAEAMKKEAAIMAKEIEQRHKEYIEKQKMKHRFDGDKLHTPLKTPGTPGSGPGPVEPVYMADGFQYLNSDEEDDQVQRPVVAWSTSKARRSALEVQSVVPAALVQALFSVRVHSPDLRAIFPAIERARLKRTSSAVWRTPPPAVVALPTLAE